MQLPKDAITKECNYQRMQMQESIKMSLVVAAAALFVAGCGKSGESAEPLTASAATDVKCLGINACKGQAQCGIPGGHGCAGQNECKSKGWLKVSQGECEAQGGHVL
jgi:hypothetical protein